MLKRIFTGLYHFVWYTFAIIILSAAVLVTVIRLALPEIGGYKNEVQAWVSEYMDYPVMIEEIEAEWQGWTPNLYLQNIDLYTQDNRSLITRFESAHIGVDLFATLSQREIVPSILAVSGLDLEFIRQLDGSISINSVDSTGLQANTNNPTALSDWLLKQKHIVLENSSISWRDKQSHKQAINFSDVRIELKTHLQRVQFGIKIALPEEYGHSLALNMDVTGNILTPEWDGEVYFNAKEIIPANLFEKFARTKGGKADFELWTHWEKAKLIDFSTKLNASDFTLISDKHSLVVNALVMNLFGKRENNKDWQLNSHIEQFETNQGYWPESIQQFRVQKNQKEAAYRFSAYFSYLKLEDIMPFIFAGQLIPEDFNNLIHWLSTQGELKDTNISFNPFSTSEETVWFSSSFNDVLLASNDEQSYATGLTGRIDGNNTAINITLNSNQSEIKIADLYEEAQSFSEIKGNLSLNKKEEYKLIVNDLNLNAYDLSLSSSGKVHFGQTSPFVDLVVHIDETNIEIVPNYLPKQTLPELREWLTHALVGGQVLSGDMIFRGFLNQYPFDQSEGHFKAILNVEHATLDYFKGWPPIDDITAEVIIDNDDLFISSSSGFIFDAEIDKVTTHIKNLTKDNNHVVVDGLIKGHTSDARLFIKQSPLQEITSLDELTNNIAGAITLDLKLDIPLGDSKTKIDGLLSFSDTTIESNLPGISLENVNGNVKFDRDHVWAEGISALYHSKPVTLSIPKIDSGIGEAETFVISGNADKSFIVNQLISFFPSLDYDNNVINQLVRGESQWQLSIKESRENTAIELQSNLKGITIDLPSPIGKAETDIRPITIKTQLKDTLLKKIDINYNNTVFTDINVDNTRDMMIENIRIGLGRKHTDRASKEKISITGNLNELDFSAWMGIFNSNKKTTLENANKKTLDSISANIHVNKLGIIDNIFNDVTIGLDPSTESWKILFDSADLKGHAQFLSSTSFQAERLQIDLEKLVLNYSEKDDNDKQTIIDKIPELDIKIDDFTYNDRAFGQLTLQTRKISNGISINNLKMNKPGISIQANGEWKRIDDIDRSEFTVALDADSIEAMLDTFNFNTANIKGGKTKIGLRANWMDTPMNFSMANVNGELDMEIGKGQFLDIDPSAGRLFGLLSLQTLPRRLSLDFTDIFNEGFAFDEIKGNFDLEQGHAYTNDLEMIGPAANIIVSGRTGITTEDYDQIATVTPKFSSTLPVASALFGPVGAGVGAVIYLAGELFESLPKQIDKILSYQYSIKGSWENPNIEKIKDEKQSG